ncbi:protein TolA [Paracoccus salsus]|uniref:protein TolA n=1 Tax=Paracoccus salsus TaxID=2911061 RepID=UPI001F216627|nr:protein TolA [Paracoccus salsus]MCF3972890.1 protein TolA [Paracoccus salsus]
MQDRDRRIGYWISGAAHLALILWAVLGGVLLRPQPSTPVRMTEVATMSGTEFETYAAASRGAGPVGSDATAVATMPAPPAEDTTGEPPQDVDAPDAEVAAQELAPPDAAEARPDLSDFQNQQPVDVAIDLPEAPVAPRTDEPAPQSPAATIAPSFTAPPAPPSASVQDQAAEPVAPRSALALDDSPRPQNRPEGLVEAYDARIAAQQAAAERAEAQRQAEAEAAARAEREAEAARRAAAEARQAEAEQQAAAERAARAAEERQAAEARAEQERRAEEARRDQERRAEDEERRAEEERRAAEAQARDERRAAEEARRRDEELAAARALRAEEDARRAAAEQEAADRAAAEREAADRRALEEALREAQNDEASAEAADSASSGDSAGVNRQRIEGGSDASAEQDPLAAALGNALSQGATDGEAAPPDREPSQLAPVPITPTPLPDPDQRSEAGTRDGGAEPLGQPLSLSEREGFRVAIQQCWNVGALSLEAARMDVSVEFRLAPDGRPDPASFRLVDQRGGSQYAAQNAFEVARRAIIICGRDGYALPPGKYNRWREVIVDFRPDGIGFE